MFSQNKVVETVGPKGDNFLSPFFIFDIFIDMKNILSYKNRFYNLLESTIGNVKPLLVESGEDELVGHSITELNIPKNNTASTLYVKLDNGNTYSYTNGVKTKLILSDACIPRDTPYTENDLPQGCEVILHLVDFYTVLPDGTKKPKEYKCVVRGRCDKYDSYAGGGTNGGSGTGGGSAGSFSSNTPTNKTEWKPNFYGGGSLSPNDDELDGLPPEVIDQIKKGIKGGGPSQQYNDDYFEL